MKYQVQHNIAECRFEVIINNLMSMVEYTIATNGTIKVTHTEVPSELENQGIAAAMTKTLLEFAKENQIKVKPICPYTIMYIKRHPEYQYLVAE